MDYIAMGATFDDTKTLRWTLHREFNPGASALVAMLNPSVGDGEKDDPTLRRLTEITCGLGFGRYTVVNWSPYITPYPADMMYWMNQVYRNGEKSRHVQQVLKRNLEIVEEEVAKADTVIVAWGNDFPASMSAGDRLSQYTSGFLSALMENYARDLYCFGITMHGAPKHPMARGAHRIKPTVKLMPWIGKDSK